jgi:hypothetical protein
VNWHWPPGHVAESPTTAVAWYGSTDWLMSQSLFPRPAERRGIGAVA